MTRQELLPIAKPILFNTEMVKAILEGRKTVTRRVVKPQPTYSPRDGFTWKGGAYGTDLPPTIQGASYNFLCAAPFKKGDYLYVRETWNHYTYDNVSNGVHKEGYFYKASPEMKEILPPYTQDHWGERWKPSLHMPKAAARLFLKVTDVRVERLQDIQSVDAFKEGVRKSDGLYGDMMGFYKLWNSTIKKADLDKYGWDANPWVWVIEFERVV